MANITSQSIHDTIPEGYLHLLTGISVKLAHIR